MLLMRKNDIKPLYDTTVVGVQTNHPLSHPISVIMRVNKPYCKEVEVVNKILSQTKKHNLYKQCKIRLFFI